jgi:hypothetical protein
MTCDYSAQDLGFGFDVFVLCRKRGIMARGWRQDWQVLEIDGDWRMLLRKRSVLVILRKHCGEQGCTSNDLGAAQNANRCVVYETEGPSLRGYITCTVTTPICPSHARR